MVLELGDNCIVFEEFPASVVDLTVGNAVLPATRSGAGKTDISDRQISIDVGNSSNTIQFYILMQFSIKTCCMLHLLA